MSRIRWFRTATVAMLALSAVAFGTASPAQATPADAALRESGEPVAVTKATIEEIRAIAAKGNGTLLTLNPGAGVSATITCVLTISPPFGGGSPGASVQVDSALQCTDWMDFVSLYVELWRDLGQAATSGAALPFVPGLFVSARVTTCTSGVYWGVATAFVRRSGFVPPSAFLHVHSVPLPVGCGSTPPPLPPPPPGGAITVNNPGNQVTFVRDPVSLQLTATGGSGSYTWSATGLPPGLSINSSTGRITGAVNSIGTADVTVTAAAGIGSVGHTRFTWTVRHEPCPTC